MLVLAVKLLFAPVFIVLTYLIQERFGARLGGAFMAVPFIVVPILVVLYLQHGRAFLTEAITGTYSGQIAMLLFIAVYARLSRRRGWVICLASATATFLVAAVLLQYMVTTVWLGVLSWLLLWAVVLGTFITYDRLATLPTAPRWDLVVRIGAALVLVFSISLIADQLGPRLSGALAMYPVMTSIMTGFNHQRFGATAAQALLHGLTQYLVVAAVVFFPVAALISRALPAGP